MKYLLPALLLSAVAARAFAGDAPPASAFGGSILERSKLTGDWWGVRDVASSNGVAVDVKLTQFYQSVASGGNAQNAEYGGKIDYYLNLDGEKAGLWEGFNLTMHTETRYGKDINGASGMFTFGNFNMAFPKAGEDVTGVTRLILSQSVSDNVRVFAGKINSLDDFSLNFTSRNGVDRFMNSAAVANIINARTVPYSTYGAGFTVFSEKGTAFTFQVRDSDDHATRTDLDKLFAHGEVLSGLVKIPVTIGGLPGDQNFGFNWSSRKFTSVDPASYENVPGQNIAAPEESGSWAAWWTFHQYLVVSKSDPKVGWGVFGIAGISDGNPNPVRWNTTFGIGGNSFIPGRNRDTFGVAGFYIGLSGEYKDLLSSSAAPPGLSQQDEQGIEIFYNVELTPWCHLTGDVQIVDPSTRSVDTTVLTGLRLNIEF